MPSVPLHIVREGAGTESHFVEAFYSSDARSWLVRAGIEPPGPSSGARLRRWETLGIVQRVHQVSSWFGEDISIILYLKSHFFLFFIRLSKYNQVFIILGQWLGNSRANTGVSNRIT